jgi:hypothetical protein
MEDDSGRSGAGISSAMSAPSFKSSDVGVLFLLLLLHSSHISAGWLPASAETDDAMRPGLARLEQHIHHSYMPQHIGCRA